MKKIIFVQHGAAERFTIQCDFVPRKGEFILYADGTRYEVIAVSYTVGDAVMHSHNGPNQELHVTVHCKA